MNRLKDFSAFFGTAFALVLVVVVFLAVFLPGNDNPQENGGRWQICVLISGTSMFFFMSWAVSFLIIYRLEEIKKRPLDDQPKWMIRKTNTEGGSFGRKIKRNRRNHGT